jgi:hypothetical protein
MRIPAIPDSGSWFNRTPCPAQIGSSSNLGMFYPV